MPGRPLGRNSRGARGSSLPRQTRNMPTPGVAKPRTRASWAPSAGGCRAMAGSAIADIRIACLAGDTCSGRRRSSSSVTTPTGGASVARYSHPTRRESCRQPSSPVTKSLPRVSRPDLSPAQAERLTRLLRRAGLATLGRRRDKTHPLAVELDTEWEAIFRVLAQPKRSLTNPAAEPILRYSVFPDGAHTAPV
jgi:hypothetical protein